MNGFIFISGKEISFALNFVSSKKFHINDIPAYGCQPCFKFPINLTPGCTAMALNGSDFIRTPAELV